MAKSIERREAADGTWETVVVDENGGGGDVPYVTGEGSPVDSVTPTAGKPLYIDTTNGTVYEASGPTNLDWIAVGNVSGNIGEATGFLVWNRSIYALAGERDVPATNVFIGSAWSQWNGSGQGLLLEYGAAAGDESFRLRAGTTGQFIATLLSGAGATTFPGRTEIEGPLVVSLNASPSTDVIAGGEAALFYDDDDVVPALRIVAKTANGTIVTGELLLT